MAKHAAGRQPLCDHDSGPPPATNLRPPILSHDGDCPGCAAQYTNEPGGRLRLFTQWCTGVFVIALAWVITPDPLVAEITSCTSLARGAGDKQGTREVHRKG